MAKRGPHGGRDPGAPGGADAAASDAAWDDERLLSVGEAADLAGVAHVTLRQWVRSGKLATRTGWREGHAVDLVRAGQLAALVPGVRQRPLSPLPLEARAVRAGPRASEGSAEAAPPGDGPARESGRDSEREPERDSERESVRGSRRDAQVAGAPPPGAELEAYRRDAERELARLRSELGEERARRRAIVPDATGAAAQLARRPANESTSREDVWTSREIPPTSRAREATPLEVAATTRASDAASRAEGVEPAASASRPAFDRSGQWTGRAVALAVAGAAVLGFVARPFVEGRSPRAGERAAGEGVRAPAPDPARRLIAVVPSAERGEAQPGLAPTEALTAVPLEAPAKAPPAVLEPIALDPRTAFERAAFRGRLTAAEAEPLTYAAVDAPPCHFHALVREGSALRGDLGPCMGPLTLAGDAVAGVHRIDGLACCRHHQLVQRLGGDVEGLASAAASARAEAVVPPLLAARIDRAAALFLRARFVRWRAAGIDEVGQVDEVGRGGARGHRVGLADDGTARVETWIELERDVLAAGAAPPGDSDPAEGDAARELTRVVRLAIELGEGAGGDALLELAVEGVD